MIKRAAVFIILSILLAASGGQAEPSSGPVAIQVKKVVPPRRLLRPIVQRKEVEAIGPARGPANAPVTIIEFADFQCPFSARFAPTLDQVCSKYGANVRLVFRQFPQLFHAFAAKAAEASLCAWDQGHFWEMHDAMFENQQSLSVNNLKAKAAELGLNADSFNYSLDSGKHAADVQRDFLAGQKAGVAGTPALFINGRFVSGDVPLEEITRIVDQELSWR